MPYGIIHFFEGGTKEQYETTLRAVHTDKDLPAGQLFHAAGPTGDGWIVMAIHDSEESWDRFRDETLMPRLVEGIDGGFTNPPEERSFDVHTHRTA